MLLLLIHIQSLQSSSCQFIYLNKTSLCFVCVPSKRSRVLLLWQIKQTIRIQLNPLFAKSFICKPKQLQNLHCSDSICWAGQGFLPANFSVTLVSSITGRTTAVSGKAPYHTPLIHWFLLMKCQLFLPPLCFPHHPHLPAPLQPCPLACVTVKPGLRLAVIDLTLVQRGTAHGAGIELWDVPSRFSEKLCLVKWSGTFLYNCLCFLLHKEKQLTHLCLAPDSEMQEREMVGTREMPLQYKLC